MPHSVFITLSTVIEVVGNGVLMHVQTIYLNVNYKIQRVKILEVEGINCLRH